ncbi:MAG: SCO family protein [Lacunisphaera sp.]|nr:SCO family protein [Lacunisphaera sp.]
MKNAAVLIALFLVAASVPNVGASLDDARGRPQGTPLQEKACCAATEKPAAPKDACCAAKSAPKPAACCPATPAPAPKACCPAPAKTENPESETENYTKESLYQLEVTFTDDTGKTVALGDLRGRPVVLNMFFASCGYACPLTVTDLLAIQERLPAAQRAQTLFVLVSFDIARDTTEVLAKYRAQRALDGQWVLLRGPDDSVRELAALLGVKYKQEADGMFSHSNLVTILNREGEIVHQRQGLKGGLEEAAAALAAVK